MTASAFFAAELDHSTLITRFADQGHREGPDGLQVLESICTQLTELRADRPIDPFTPTGSPAAS